MIFLTKRAQFILKAPFGMVRFLCVDVLNKSTQISRPNRKQTIPTLPGKGSDSLLFHPARRTGLDLRDDLCGSSYCGQTQSKMNMVGNTADTEALATQTACRSSEICMKSWSNFITNQRSTPFRAEDDVHQIQAQRLRHRRDYMLGLQPSLPLAPHHLGLRRRIFDPLTRDCLTARFL
jgi:hypothetical protein